MKNTKLVLGTVYYLLLVAALIAAMAGYWLIMGHSELVMERGSGPALLSYNIMLWYVIITLPGALTLYRLGVKQLVAKRDREDIRARYTGLGLARMLVIGLGLIASILIFYISGERSMFWLAAIEAVGLVFCKPTTRKIDSELNADEDAETEEGYSAAVMEQPAESKAPAEETEQPAETERQAESEQPEASKAQATETEQPTATATSDAREARPSSGEQAENDKTI